MRRLDLALVEWGFAPTRSKAQTLIAAGEVEILRQGQWQKATDKNENVESLTPTDVRLAENNTTLRYVSRGGLKLESAVEFLNLNVKGFRCLDIGQSTGGFTDFLLQAGAAEVLGFDVGHGQLSPVLGSHPQVKAIAGLHVRDAESSKEIQQWLATGVDLAVADLSFISLVQVFPSLSKLLPRGVPLLALVKPQFEVGPQTLTEALLEDVKGRVLQAAGNCGFVTESYFASRVRGQDGTQEYFLYCRRS
jgi:23S rRNA (cytidine1920-2'-O)/16S rRNA (cytidine1409-2'-O)-methyltransferase